MNLLLQPPPHLASASLNPCHRAFAFSRSFHSIPRQFRSSVASRFFPFAVAFLAEKPPPSPSTSAPPVVDRDELLHSLNQDFENRPSRWNEPSKFSNAAARLSDAPTEMGLTDTSLESTWVHRVWIGIGFAAMGGVVFKAAESVDSIEGVTSIVLAAASAYVLADLSTGIYHWAVDNYGDANTPIFGAQIDGFQGHHRRPWTITKRQFANNIHALARPASFTLLPFLFLPSNAVLDTFLGFFLAFVVLSQQCHSWAHCKKKDLPAIVVKLQDTGLLVSRKMHGAHHKSPYDINYCIVNGMWNPLLDRNKFFSKLESFIFEKWGVEPRCWSKTAPEWLQEDSYFADGTDADVCSKQ